ncbi:hypothetical protein VSS74_16090 [Conexibacter stalactiti]|uniref:Uncharacterized protein n=1 Tax=Conexibacter stalactiti TaxID=1940611 RepID=A0ABU4HRE4_9ACTN|nr:hypothetical protein [Conexibacter stalactiti]MDW5595870.1 hypothetical protein [Conexibacter stalactiti]MEC5036512.1 hypothetical protein [Conexibacter stalactiti]
MALFFIDTDTGQIATRRQLVEAGLMTDTDGPERPWFRIQGTDDATTLWYAVMRKETRGIFIGALAIRHSDHHASLLNQGWKEISVEELRAGPTNGSAQAM